MDRTLTQSITIKGTRDGLAILLKEEGEFQEVLDALKQKFSEGGSFFSGGEVTLDLGVRPLQEEECSRLKEVVEESQVRLKGILSDSPITKILAQQLGLQVISTGSIIHSRTRQDHPVRIQRMDGTFPGTVRSSETSGKGGAASPPVPGVAAEPTLLVRRSLRAGHKVNMDGNVLILGDLHPGAEIVASGDVLVLGSLKGMVHAGATGKESSFVLALDLDPTQLRIARYVARSPEGAGGRRKWRRRLGASTQKSGKPEVARIKDGAICVEGFSGNLNLDEGHL